MTKRGIRKVKCGGCGKEFFEDNLVSHCWSRDPAHARVLRQLFEEKISEWTRDFEMPKIGVTAPTGEQVAREIIRACTQGQPPNFGTVSMTVGRTAALGEISALVDRADEDGSSHRIFVSGEPGSGKSHILNCARDIASQRKLLILHTQLLDGGVLPSNEGAFARALLRGLRFPFLLSERDRRDILVALAMKQAQADARRIAREDLHEDLLSLSQFQFFVLKSLTNPAGGPTWFLESISRLVEESTMGEGAELDLSFDSLERFERETVSLARYLGFRGCLYLVDELEAARDADSFRVLEVVLSRSLLGAAWILTGTRDLMRDPRNGIEATAPGLADLLKADQIELPALTPGQLLELARKLEMAFRLAYPSLTTRQLIPEKELRRLIEESGRAHHGVRTFIMNLVSAMQDLRLTVSP